METGFSTILVTPFDLWPKISRSFHIRLTWTCDYSKSSFYSASFDIRQAYILSKILETVEIWIVFNGFSRKTSKKRVSSGSFFGGFFLVTIGTQRKTLQQVSLLLQFCPKISFVNSSIRYIFPLCIWHVVVLWHSYGQSISYILSFFIAGIWPQWCELTEKTAT